jgi:branched-chain amino acid transport system substrate-binding protein
LVRGFRQSRIEGAVIGTAPLGRRRFLSLAGAAAEGVRLPLLYPTRQTDERTRHFVRQFKAQFGADPDYAEVFTYDAAALLLQAISSTALNRARIRREISRISPWQGISGPITWDGTGQNTRAVTRMGIISQGRLKVLDEPGEE